MKVLLSLSLICLIACSEKHTTKSLIVTSISESQKTLFSILDSFKTEFYSANSVSLKDSALNKWQLKLNAYLRYKHLDSIMVHTDSVVVEGWKITTQFHCGKEIQFNCSLTFNEKMNRNAENCIFFYERTERRHRYGC